jgi:integral membrane protein
MIAPSYAAEELSQLRRMRVVSIIEGSTLLILVFVAVPLKHLGGHAIATAIMGPLHGMAFLLYVWTLIQTVSSADLPRPDVVRMVVAAFIPFGAFFNERTLRRRQAMLAPIGARNRA